MVLLLYIFAMQNKRKKNARASNYRYLFVEEKTVLDRIRAMNCVGKRIRRRGNFFDVISKNDIIVVVREKIDERLNCARNWRMVCVFFGEFMPIE